MPSLSDPDSLSSLAPNSGHFGSSESASTSETTQPSGPPLPPERIAAFWRAVVRVRQPDGRWIALRALELGAACRGRFPYERPLWILSGQNPNTTLLPPPRNRLRHRRLGRMLGRLDLDPIPVVGEAPEGADVWRELHWAIAGAAAPRILRLGRAFAQDAVFAWERDCLRLVFCADGSEERRPWEIVHEGVHPDLDEAFAAAE